MKPSSERGVSRRFLLAVASLVALGLGSIIAWRYVRPILLWEDPWRHSNRPYGKPMGIEQHGRFRIESFGVPVGCLGHDTRVDQCLVLEGEDIPQIGLLGGYSISPGDLWMVAREGHSPWLVYLSLADGRVLNRESAGDWSDLAHARWAPDRKKLLIETAQNRNRTLAVIDFTSVTPHSTTMIEIDQAEHFQFPTESWSPDSKSAAVFVHDGGLCAGGKARLLQFEKDNPKILKDPILLPASKQWPQILWQDGQAIVQVKPPESE
ncbi:MAG: hypothetical protein HYY18_15495 [Planctomycetes bacterium]|nr:hypothetical protein [Planctomycetota bacterium]